jgi:hypothetical protein
MPLNGNGGTLGVLGIVLVNRYFEILYDFAWIRKLKKSGGRAKECS